MDNVFNAQAIVVIVHQVLNVILVIRDTLNILMDYVTHVQNNVIAVHLLEIHQLLLVQHAKIPIMLVLKIILIHVQIVIKITIHG